MGKESDEPQNHTGVYGEAGKEKIFDESPRVAVIVLNWNGLEDTLTCIEALREPSYSNVCIIVADNGSTDGSLDVFKKKYPDLLYVENGENLGYAEGNNRGLKQAISAGADYVLFLNNDVKLDPACIPRLVNLCESDPSIGIAGPRVYRGSSGNQIWFDRTIWHPKRGSFEFPGSHETETTEDSLEPVDNAYIVGCALFARVSTLKQTGYFDPRFFLTWEDVDLAYRVRKQGGRVVLFPQARCWHKPSSSFHSGPTGPMYRYFYYRNRLLWIRKNFSLPIAVFYLGAQVYRHLRLRLQGDETGKLPFGTVANRAILDFSLCRFGNCPDWIRSARS